MLKRILKRTPVMNFRGVMGLANRFSFSEKSTEEIKATMELQEILQGSGLEHLLDDEISEEERSQFMGNFMMEASEKISNSNCRGCGARFQFEDDAVEGFMDMQQYLRKNDEKGQDQFDDTDFLMASMEEEDKDEGYFDIGDYVENEYLPDVKKLKDFMDGKENSDLICQRCQDINKGDLKSVVESYRVDVNSKSRKYFLTDLFKRIDQRAVLVLVLDICDFEGSYCEELIQKIEDNGNRLVVVINKRDILPKTIKDHRLKTWARNNLEEKNPIFQSIGNRDIIFVSAKNGQGFPKLTDRLKEINSDQGSKKGYIFILGTTNSGKTSVITQLRKSSKKFNPKYYHDPFDIKAAELKGRTLENETFKEEKERGEPTISFLPGTTLKPIEISNVKIGTKVFDTPGLPTLTRVTDFMNDPNQFKRVLMTKNQKPKSFVIDQGGSIWVGALLRIDHFLGPSVNLTFTMSDELTYSKFTQESATLNYLKNRTVTLFPSYRDVDETDVKFERTEIELTMDMNKGVHSEEISVHGLGWINLKNIKGEPNLNKKKLTLEFYACEGVKIETRRAIFGHLDLVQDDLNKIKRRSIKKNY